MGSLSGKNAVVTGSTSGIGLAYARAFAGAGEPELPLLSVPVNRLSRKFSGLPDCASAEPDTARADATIAALVPVLKAASMTFRRIVISSIAGKSPRRPAPA